MTESEFIDYWNLEYPESFPINHELKRVYSNRWFRIHSLPNSKRYAESEKEYNILLGRQNQIINDLIEKKSVVFISFGNFQWDSSNNNYKKQTDYGEFQKVLRIDLQKFKPEEYEDYMFFDIYVKAEKWENINRNKILKAIANDEIRAMFFCPSKKCVIAPYDGGLDVIVDSVEKKDILKAKYKDWLSEQKDGM